MESFTIRLVGMTFVPSYPASAWRMHGMLEAGRERMWTTAWRESDEAPDGTNGASRLEADEEPALRALLVREPHNKKDRNAIAVYCPALGRGEAGRLGHIPKEDAKSLARNIDDGIAYQAAVSDVIGAEDIDNPGIEIKLWVVRPAT